MYRLWQVQLRDRAACHIECIEDGEGILITPGIEDLTDHCAVILISQIWNEDWLSAEIAARRRLIDVARLSSVPICMNKLIEELSPALSRRRDAEHPEIVIGLCRQPRINRSEIRREP